jgi:hypothetical protein
MNVNHDVEIAHEQNRSKRDRVDISIKPNIYEKVFGSGS